MSDKNETCLKLLEMIEQKTARIGIIGLGYVGLPLGIHFGRKGFRVTGFDLDSRKIDKLLHGESYIKHIPAGAVKELIDAKQLDVTIDFSRLQETDCILICVPTPLTEKLEPDLSYLLNTTETIADNLRIGQLIVLESTTYPGTTREMLLPRLESNDMKVGRDFFLAFSPEREDPGNQKYTATNIPKVVGGITRSCLDVATAMYNAITRAVPVSSTQTAEMAKLLENTFRSVNIALVNELKILAHKMDIDLFEVIEAAATKPFGYTPFYPGPGLGGHCIPIDPFYLTWKAREYEMNTRFIELAGEINTNMPYWVVQKVMEALNEHNKSLKGAKVLVLGAAYKKDIDDMRESPSVKLMEILMEKGATVDYNDPYVPELPKMRLHDLHKKSVDLNETVLKNYDCVLISTDHSSYDWNFIVKNAQLVVDTRNATLDVKQGREKIFKA